MKDIPFDNELQNRESYIDENGNEEPPEIGFYYWGVNYYSYESINHLLGELTQAIFLLQENFNNPRLSKLKDYLRYDFDYLFLQKFYPRLDWELLSEADKDVFIQKHHYIISDFYDRFIQKMRKMMNDNPDSHLVYFAGP
ncbi:hypothetical protein HT664_04410 [Ursidibacter maritimus]|nr:hypothetical protein [Ursidibacter maritimus]MBV6548877.1 hypothetical protein [Ursidibacter maritimus]